MKAKGFTLLETLLVLAILAVLVTAGLSYYQQKVLYFKVDKTVLQMEQIAEAAIQYHTDKSQWPTKAEDFAPYTDPNILNNCPWYPNTAQCYEIEQGGDSPMFKLSVTIPPSYGSTKQQNIATMIASRLPVASVSSGTVTDTVNIRPAFASAPPSSGMIIETVTAAQADGQTSLKLAGCPTGYTQKVFYALSAWATQNYKPPPYDSGGPVSAYQGIGNVQGGAPGTSVFPTVTGIDYHIGGPGEQFQNISDQALVIETCIPNSSVQAAQAKPKEQLKTFF